MKGSADVFRIDIGTSGVKVVLIDDAQTDIDSASSAVDIHRPQSGFSEQNPDWWCRRQRAVSFIQSRHPKELSAVKSIGLSAQMHD